MSTADSAQTGATLIANAWHGGTTLDALPDTCRPTTLAQGYQIASALGAAARDRVVGWKIAATSAQGQAHIGVDGPVAGRLFAGRVFASPASVSLTHNHMCVAECEFVFRLKHSLPPAATPYTRAQVLAAIDSTHIGVELPSSRFTDFASAGAAQLAADNACAHHMVIGPAVDVDIKTLDLASVRTYIHINGESACTGSGSDVLGHPLDALAWLANSHVDRGEGIDAGQFVTTGVTGQPTPVSAGNVVTAGIEGFGEIRVELEV